MNMLHVTEHMRLLRTIVFLASSRLTNVNVCPMQHTVRRYTSYTTEAFYFGAPQLMHCRFTYSVLSVFYVIVPGVLMPCRYTGIC